MSIRIVLAVIAAALCCSCGKLLTRTAEYRPQEAGTVDQALCLLGFTGVPLREAAVTGHHLVSVELNGGSGVFILDTGANVSVVDIAHADAFNLSPSTSMSGRAFGVGGGQTAALSPIETMRIGGAAIRLDRIALADISQASAVLSRLTGGPIHGIIGQDVMKEHRAVIDVARPILYLIEADEEPAPIALENCTA